MYLPIKRMGYFVLRQLIKTNDYGVYPLYIDFSKGF